MTKETFATAINALMSQYDLDRKNEKLIGEVFGMRFEEGYNNRALVNAIFDMFWDEFPKDKNAHSNIEYYCWELDFGRKWEVGKMTFQDSGKDIPLGTPEDLWNELCRVLEYTETNQPIDEHR